MGKLKLVDPMSMAYPLITARPDGGALNIEVRTNSNQIPPRGQAFPDLTFLP